MIEFKVRCIICNKIIDRDDKGHDSIPRLHPKVNRIKYKSNEYEVCATCGNMITIVAHMIQTGGVNTDDMV